MPKSTETRKKISDSRKRNPIPKEKHPNFNKTWKCINNGISNERIGIDDQIPEGWVRGELQNHLRKSGEYRCINNGERLRFVSLNHINEEGWENGTLYKGDRCPAFGTKHTEEWKKEHSERMSGENNPKYGSIRTKEQKQNQSDKMKGRYVGDKNPMAGSSFDWINNGNNNVRHDKDKILPRGYIKGYLQKINQLKYNQFGSVKLFHTIRKMESNILENVLNKINLDL